MGLRTSPDRLVISQGMTFSGWSPYLGFVLFLVGALFTVAAIASETLLLLVITLPCTAFGLVTFMKIRGTVIDIPQQRIMLYQHFLFFKVGTWMPLSHFDHVAISLHRERFHHSASGFLDTKAHVRSYFVDLRGPKTTVLLNECDSHQNAVKLARMIVEACPGLNVVDHASEARSRQIKRRRSMVR